MSWEPERLLEDVETKPAMLRGLATALRDGTGWPDLGRPRAVLLLGIGSSRYAAEVAARRMRSQGIAATAESSSIARVTPIADDTLVVVISAGGSSAETLAAARAVSTSSRVIGLTNAPSSVLAEVVGWAVPMDAGEEVSGVASRTFTATLVRLLELEVLLTGGPGLGGLADSVDAAAAAIDDVLAQRPSWLGEAVEALVGPDGTWLLAPLERWSSAMQGALMLREVPRRLAVGCETGEWSHVDVYLTLGRDYRAPGVRRLAVGRPSHGVVAPPAVDVLGDRRQPPRSGAHAALRGRRRSDRRPARRGHGGRAARRRRVPRRDAHAAVRNGSQAGWRSRRAAATSAVRDGMNGARFNDQPWRWCICSRVRCDLVPLWARQAATTLSQESSPPSERGRR